MTTARSHHFARPQSHALRSARAVSLASLAWTALISVCAMGAGLRTRGLTLVAFALSGTLDAAGSAVLVDHFDRHVRDSRQPRHSERLALRVISIGMYAVGIATLIESGWRLVHRSPVDATLVGPAIAAASLVGLSFLAHRKTVIARRVDSAGLMADAHLSRIGIALAAVSLAGTGLGHLSSATWLDPAAALVIAVVALVVAHMIAADASKS